MESRRLLWIGLIFGILILVITVCVSCGALLSSLPEYLESFPQLYLEESNIPEQPQQEIDYANLPTPALKVDVPSFGEGELPVGAVVQIVVDGLVYGNSEQWSGSGTIISPDGLILTNAHVAVGDRFYHAQRLTIGLTVAEDKPPVPAYIAEVVQADMNLDIAVIRIVRDISGQHINTVGLGLPYVQLGDSDALSLGDDITVLGYPGIGGQTITLTSGKVSGFTSEAGYGNRAFIKTSATIAGGNSGGLAMDEDYRLIGIPSQVGAGEVAGDVVDCRPLADTNRDGYINEYDTCVPTGGFINALRPVNLAIPLINAAIEGADEVYSAAAEVPTVEVRAGADVFYEDDFSDPNSGWPEGQNSDEAIYYQNGRYYIAINSSNFIRPITGGDYIENMIIHVETRVEASSQTGDYGVMCRYQDDDNQYVFEITQDAYYAIYKLVNGEWYWLIDYTYSPLLEDVTNATFDVSCVGARLTFTVNGVLLAEVDDNSLSAGDYGFFAGTFATGGNTVSFDNLKVSIP